MPLPVIGAGGAAIIAGASSLLGGGVNAMAQGKMNKKTRKWNEKMYNIQREHALLDWNMQNTYNSPEMQMQRLKDAGLNPNLVYGNGAVATSGSAPRSSSAGSWNPKAPDFGSALSEGVFGGMSTYMQMEQMENMRTQRKVMETDILKKVADMAWTKIKTARSDYDLKMQQDLRETIFQTAEANLKLINTRNQLGVAETGDKLSRLDAFNKYGQESMRLDNLGKQQQMELRDAANARAESQNVADLKIKAQKVINMLQDNTKTFNQVINLQEAAKHIRRANTLQEIDIWMKSAGFDWKDPLVLRQLRFSSRGYQK